MPTHALILVAFGAAFGSWALLTLMGGERTRRMNEARAQQARAAAPPNVLSVQVPVVGIAQPASKPPAAKANHPAPPKSKSGKPAGAVAGKNER